jgi:hypothetical protein
MSKALSFTQNNFGANINVNITNISKKPVVLDGYSLEIDIVFPDRTKKTFPLVIIDSVNGKAQLVTTIEMTSQIGTHMGYIDIIGTKSRITLDESIRYNVKPQDGGV